MIRPLLSREVGPAGGDEGAEDGSEFEGDPLVQWSETFVALVTLNCFVVLLLDVPALAPAVGFMPEF
jgi:hypothetical protein